MRQDLLTTFALALSAVVVACTSPGNTNPAPTPDVPGVDTSQDNTGNVDSGSDTQPDAASDVTVDLPPDLSAVDINNDLIVGVPDISVVKQPLAGVCVADDDCIDGWCNTNYTGGYCSLQCSSASDCPDAGPCYDDPNGGGKMCWKPCQFPNDCRPDQFCASGANICTPKCVPDSCSQGYECNQGTGECNPVGTVTCTPSLEVCDNQDNDCDGAIDEGCGPEIQTHPNYIVQDLGLVAAGGDGLSQVLEFDISSGAKGFQIIILSADASEEYIAIFELKTPSGVSIVSGLNPYDHLNRSWYGYGIATTHVPITPEVTLESGKHQMSIYRSGALSQVWVYVVQSIRANVVQSKIDFNFWFVGTTVNAVTAGTNNKFQNLLSKFAQLLAEHGITINNLNFYDVLGADAQKYAIVDSGQGSGVDEHGELLRLSSALPASNKGLNFFFVQGFTGWGLLGRAGGIPGPVIQGTSDSGVVVSMADYYVLPSNLGVPLTAHAMVHEMGHQLGLSHTSEQALTPDGWIHDPIGDTPKCENDIDKNGMVDSGECIGNGHDNVMFWSAHFSNALTAGQLFVIHRSPYLAEP